ALLIAREDDGAHRRLHRLANGAAPELQEVPNPLRPESGRGGYGGPRGCVVLACSLVQGEHRTIGAPYGTARAGSLLVRHSHGAVEDRPTYPISGIELVVALATEVRPALAVERRRVCGCVDVPPAQYALV